METPTKKTSLLLDEEEYQLFKKNCKKNNSDASKEIRKFIKSYNERCKTKSLLKKSIL